MKTAPRSRPSGRKASSFARGVRRVISIVALAGAIAVCSVGCAAGGTGPLKIGGDGSSLLCISAGPEESVVYGDVASLADDVEDPVALDSFDMEGAGGTEFYVLPMEGMTSQGAFRASEPPEVWKQRQRAEGYVIEPGGSANIVVVFPQRGDSEIDAGPLDIAYHVEGGRAYKTSASTRVIVNSTCTDVEAGAPEGDSR